MYGILNALLAYRLKTRLYIMLFWNVFLAFIPYLLVCLGFHIKSKILKMTIFVVALLFWPNAMYLVTDFIHLSYETFFLSISTYSREILPWIKLMDISLGFIFGYLMSLECVVLVLDSFKIKKLNRHVFAIILFFIGSIGIFIGRFIRLNSWDLVNPISVIQKLILNIDLFAFLFITVLTLFSYFSFWMYENWKAK